MVKNLPAVQETKIQSLCQEDLLEKGMATHTSILAWRIPWTEKPGGLQSMELQSQTRLSDKNSTKNPTAKAGDKDNITDFRQLMVLSWNIGNFKEIME